MSLAELQPLFPSVSHPAIPIAVQILSTLRTLTGPGKGNDLKPEERAALVGVSALLGCENKDLIEKTAQKASSVAPAHFRSALRRARAIIASIPSDELSPSSSSRRKSTRNSGSASPSPSRRVEESDSEQLAEAAGSGADAIPSPFQTPKKKFKFSSGIDISGLVKHSPSKASPLKQSMTPTPHRKVRNETSRIAGAGVDEDEDEDEDMEGTQDRTMGEHDMDEQAEDRTPTKARHAAPPLPPSTARRRMEDMSAFLALRPGAATDMSAGQSGASGSGKKRAVSPGAEYDFDRAIRPKRVRTVEERRRRKLREKRDWTFSEHVWDGAEVRKRNEGVLSRLGVVL